MKLGRKPKYDPSLIKKAVKMYKQGGYSLKSVAHYFGLPDKGVLRYHINPEAYAKHLRICREWAIRNKDKKRAKEMIWRKNNREKINAIIRTWFYKKFSTPEKRRAEWKRRNEIRKANRLEKTKSNE